MEAGVGAQQIVGDEHAEAEVDNDEGEVGVGVGDWAFVDSLAILSRTINIDYRASPVVDSSRLDFGNNFSGPFRDGFDNARFENARLERSSSGTFTLVINSHCPDSTFIFPIDPEAFLVINNCQQYSTIDVIPCAIGW